MIRPVFCDVSLFRRKAMSCPLKPLFLLASALFAVCPAVSPARAVSVSADSNGGYGAQVMDVILANWQKPANASGSTSVIVRITNDGRPFSCELRKSSGNPGVDESICLAVAKAGSFPPTPYAAPAEVALTFIYDAPSDGSGEAPAPLPPKSYADILMDNARPYLEIPEGLTGRQSVTLRLHVKGDGALAQYQVEQSSGSAALDTAVLRALLQPGVIPAPPGGREQNVALTFNVEGN
jgi:TonB family protein